MQKLEEKFSKSSSVTTRASEWDDGNSSVKNSKWETPKMNAEDSTPARRSKWDMTPK